MSVAAESGLGKVGVRWWNGASSGKCSIIARQGTGCRMAIGCRNNGTADVESVEEDREASHHLHYVSLHEATG